MSLILISDTHLRGGDAGLPEQLTALLRSAEMIAHAGDIVTVDAFNYLQAAGKITAVAGNMDQFQLAARLPEKIEFTYSGRRVGLIHGHQVHDLDNFNIVPDDDYSSPGMNPFYEYLDSEFPNCDIIAFGHFHLPGIIPYKKKLIINPGTANPRAQGRSCAKVRIDGDAIEADIIHL